jgi:hypothetical protein
VKVLILCLILVLVTAFQAPASEERILTIDQWLEDLEFATLELRLHHPNLYHGIDEMELESIIAESRNEITQSKKDLECYFAIRKVVAAIEDGHTQLLETGIFNLLDLRFPFRVDEFTDGVYVTIIGKEHEMFLGSRVVAINNRPIENVLATLMKVVSCDNEFGRKYIALNGISFARILYGLNIIADTDYIELTVITNTGESSNLMLHSIPDDTPVEWGWNNQPGVGPTKGEYVSPADMLAKATPLHLKNQGQEFKYYWFEQLPKEKAIYFQFNQIMDQPNRDETFAQFSTRMWDYIDQNEENIDKLIIDLRYNNGGNGIKILPLLNRIIKRDFINKEGCLFVISGKKTFSAASILMYELAVHTNAIFVGEPDGCGSDLFSNSRLAGNLPHSGFPLWIATLQFTSRWPVNNTDYFMPRFPTPFSSHDYFTGLDPAMDLILKGDLRSVDEFAADEGAEAALIYCQQLKDKYKELEWWTALDPGILQGSINSKGYALMQNGDLERAVQVLTLNTMLFPGSSNVWDSLGECSYNMKRYNLSLQCYEKSVALNPDNENGKQMIESIKGEQENR